MCSLLTCLGLNILFLTLNEGKNCFQGLGFLCVNECGEEFRKAAPDVKELLAFLCVFMLWEHMCGETRSGLESWLRWGVLSHLIFLMSKGGMIAELSTEGSCRE